MTSTANASTAVADGAADAPSGTGTRLLCHRVRGLRLGTETVLVDGMLTVDQGAAAALFAHPALASVRLRTASPGESVRIVGVLDVVEPRSKGPAGGVFPGFLGPSRPTRTPDVQVLQGMAVLAAGHLPRNQEGIVDMSGPAAALSPYATTHNLVVEFDRADGADWAQVDDALRLGLLRLAVHCADAALSTTPDEVVELPPPTPPRRWASMPRVGVVTNLQTQGAFKDVFVHGRSMAGALPTWIDPGEVDDGAVVSGQYGHPGLRNATWAHQNHPVLAELRARHGRDLEFAGLVLCPEPIEQAAKEHMSGHAARLCVAAGFDAAVVTKEGGGNADADVSMKLDALEDLGVHAVGIFAEMSGTDGVGPPVVSPPRRATAMVSVGNYDQRVALPAMERSFGGDRVEIADAAATDAMDLPTAAIHGSLSPLGWGRLTARVEA